MNVLVTGSKGFVGRNLLESLKNIRDDKDKTYENLVIDNIFEFDVDCSMEELAQYANEADFVFHLAGVNRPQSEDEFVTGNTGLTEKLLQILGKKEIKTSVLLSSSIQAACDNPYGKSKKAAEDLVLAYGHDCDVPVYVYRLPNVFGKWCRPNYNSVVATFCHNIANDLPITIHDRDHLLTLVYIDDVVQEMIQAICGNGTSDGKFFKVSTTHQITVGEIADLLYEFKNSRETKYAPDVTEGSFSKKLYATYLSYLDKKDVSYPLDMHCDQRGSFTEIMRSKNAGQFSVNVSKPGITKGNHWHHTKSEKFIVVHGKGLIEQRKIDSDEILSYEVSGENLTVVEILPGYTHRIINLSDTEDLVTIMWCNECFNPEKPDTYFEEI